MIEENSQGAEQQAAQLEQLEALAAAEDFQPGPESALEGEHQHAEPEISTGELCTALLSIGFSVVASRRGSHWALNETEAKETGQAVGAVLDKYFPDMANHGPELTALMTVGAVLTPRLMIDKQQTMQQERQRQEPSDSQKRAEEAATAKEVGADGD